MSFKGGNDKNAFLTYINQVLVPNLWKGACVVMDNFSSHKVAGIKEAIESVGAHLIYLSPYSPDFSPIENFWSKVKEFLRSQQTRTYSDLDKAITQALETINLSDIIGWFQPQWLLYCTQLRTAIFAAFDTSMKKVAIELFRINGGKQGYYIADIQDKKYYYCGTSWEDVKFKLRELGIGKPDSMES